MNRKENELEEVEGKNPLLELDLSRITLLEGIKYSDDFNEYKKHVSGLLIVNHMVYSEKEILEGFKDISFPINNIDELLHHFPHVVPAGAIMSDEGEAVGGLFMNLAHKYFVQPEDVSYSVLFAYNLRQLSIFRIDRTLDYHLVNYYGNNLLDFSHFLSLCIRKYKNTLLMEDTIETVKEWMVYRENKQKEALRKEMQEDSENSTLKNKKGKVKREAGDKKTLLSQEQTVLLMYYLQQDKIILKDEYLTDMDAGKAFETLTGYSQHTLRQNLSKYFLLQNKENLKAIDNMLTRLRLKIDQDLKGK